VGLLKHWAQAVMKISRQIEDNKVIELATEIQRWSVGSPGDKS